MKNQPHGSVPRISPASLSLLVLFCMATMSARAGFDATTVARRYNFSISGASNSNNSNLAMVGWFDATGSDLSPNGKIASGQAELSMAASNMTAMASAPISTRIDSTIQLVDATNGTYAVFLRFDWGQTSCVTTMRLIVDDTLGKGGRLEGTYSCAVTFAVYGGGVVHGDIKAP